MKPTRTLYITQAAVIAAAYILLTLPFGQLASEGPIQIRPSEAMTVLPALFPAAIPGLFLGCLLSNLFNPASLGPVDIVFGSLATLLAAVTTRTVYLALKNRPSMIRRVLALIPPVLFNALIVGTYLAFLLRGDSGALTFSEVLLWMGSVGFSEAFWVYVIGLPLLIGMEKYMNAKSNMNPGV